MCNFPFSITSCSPEMTSVYWTKMYSLVFLFIYILSCYRYSFTIASTLLTKVISKQPVSKSSKTESSLWLNSGKAQHSQPPSSPGEATSWYFIWMHGALEHWCKGYYPECPSGLTSAAKAEAAKHFREMKSAFENKNIPIYITIFSHTAGWIIAHVYMI